VSEPPPVRRRKAVVAVAARNGDHALAVETITQALGAVGVEAMTLGRVDNAARIAAAVSEAQAEAIQLCIADGATGVPLLRELLRELIRRDLRSVSIVVHRIRDPTPATLTR
jgi:methylmalonyl-CoA mutase cobalamin-binding subunit